MIGFLTRAIRVSTVFLFGSTGETITEKAGHLNLGIPGVMSVGAAVGCVTEYFLIKSMGTSVPFLLVLIPILTTFLAGALMGALYSFFTVNLRANQNITGLAMTTFGVGLCGYIMTADSKIIVDAAKGCRFFNSLFPFASDMGEFGKMFFSYGILVYLAIIIAIITQIVFSKTKVGLRLRAVGENPATADAVGVNVSRYKYFATCIGCGIAALGGLFYLMDYTMPSEYPTIEGFGWLSVALVIFTLWKPALSIFGGILFAALYIMFPYTGLPSGGVYSAIIDMLTK